MAINLDGPLFDRERYRAEKTRRKTSGLYIKPDASIEELLERPSDMEIVWRIKTPNLNNVYEWNKAVVYARGLLQSYSDYALIQGIRRYSWHGIELPLGLEVNKEYEEYYFKHVQFVLFDNPLIKPLHFTARITKGHSRIDYKDLVNEAYHVLRREEEAILEQGSYD